MPAGRSALAPLVLLALYSCETGGERIELPPLEPRMDDLGNVVFTCTDEEDRGCVRNVHQSCYRVDEFLEVERTDCTPLGKVCDKERVCIECSPGTFRCAPCEADDVECDPHVLQRCREDGSGFEEIERCDYAAGIGCYDDRCESACARASSDKSYVGCEFYAVDLDNAAISPMNDASSQQFAVAVANVQDVPVDVKVEINQSEPGAELDVDEVERVTVPPGGLEVFRLPRREVDGSSVTGLNDGTHTALTSNAYLVSSSHPIIAYQFNPLENVGVFSNDASLLLPVGSVGDTYTVIGWPQTIGDSDDPADDFDSTTSEEDLRAFLTIVGTEPDTRVEVTLGAQVRQVVGGGPIDAAGPFEQITQLLGPFDVLNLETEGLNADFTGSRIRASAPVTVFIGNEASDVPRFGTYEFRQCCADHLEEQLFPDSALGSLFSVARMPARTAALAEAAPEGESLDIALADELEWVRVVAIEDGTTEITTTLPAPDDEISLEAGEDRILVASQDFMLEASQRVAVLQALPSQGVTGIPRQYPGGDPSIIAVPPLQQFRQSYVFLTPDKYAFDFVVIMAEADTQILLDGEELPDHCTTSPAEGPDVDPEAPPIAGRPPRVVHRCQLSFPEVTRGVRSETRPGRQNDGVHTLVANQEVGIVVYGFDRFVSYAYVGGLDLDVLN